MIRHALDWWNRLFSHILEEDMADMPYGPNVRVISKPWINRFSQLHVQVNDDITGWTTIWQITDDQPFALERAQQKARETRAKLLENERV